MSHATVCELWVAWESAMDHRWTIAASQMSQTHTLQCIVAKTMGGANMEQAEATAFHPFTSGNTRHKKNVTSGALKQYAINRRRSDAQ